MFAACWGNYKMNKAGGISLANVSWLWKHKGNNVIYDIVNRHVEHGMFVEYLQWAWHCPRVGDMSDQEAGVDTEKMDDTWASKYTNEIMLSNEQSKGYLKMVREEKARGSERVF